MSIGTRTQQAKIARAMTAQLDRVNGEQTQRKIDELGREIERLEFWLKIAREKVAKLEGENEILRAQIESAGHVKQQVTASRPLALPGLSAPAAPMMLYKSRPASTPKAIAARYNVHVSTVIRYLQAGRIAGEQMTNSNRWIVYTDTLIKFERMTERKKK